MSPFADPLFEPPFPAFKKIPRLNREVVITEKIDGTNGVIEVFYDVEGDLKVRAGSRSRWITPYRDNFGFARWVKENDTELLKLGPGLHYGEWFGSGIQRGYGLKEKRFALFNAGRWIEGKQFFDEPFKRTYGKQIESNTTPVAFQEFTYEIAPKCCRVVPILWRGSFRDLVVDDWCGCCLNLLRTQGSLAVPGFMKPEGIVVYHTAGNNYYKVTLENDEKPKSGTVES